MAVMITTEHLLLQIPLLGEARDGLMLKHDLTRLTAVLNGSCGVPPEGAHHTKSFSHRDAYN